MEKFLARTISSISPEWLLPEAFKQVNNQRLPLNIAERRELLERKVNHRVGRFLDKYSIIRRTKQFQQERRLRKTKNNFYGKIGEITLLHAGIEQDLKNTLLVDWDAPEKSMRNGREVNLNFLYGQKLRKEFLRALKELLAPQEHLLSYKSLCDEFAEISSKRNDTLKAIYSFNNQTSEIHKVHEKNHAKYDDKQSFEQHIQAWIPKIDIDDIQTLKIDLEKLRQEFINIRVKIFSEKLRLHGELCCEIGKTYPLYALKNPYLYMANIGVTQEEQL